MRSVYASLVTGFFFMACIENNTRLQIAEPVKAISSLSRQEMADGWELLYDGKSKSGWHVYLDRTDGSAWKSRDGLLFLDPGEKFGWQSKAGGDLVTDSIFEDFHLSMEWMISEKGNSGVLFLVQEDSAYPHTWISGLEMQLIDNTGNPESKIMNKRAGTLFGILPSFREPVNSPGRWNSIDIRLEKGKLDMFMNNKLVVSTRTDDKTWNELIAKSEFAAYPGFGSYKRGHIALQDHGFPVWFRNIRIRRL